MIDLSIVIVSYNARADLECCLASLHDFPPAIPHDIVVVDNASTDGSADAARRWIAVRVIALPENVGFSAGNNVGIRASSGRLILLLNSDTLVPKGAIDRFVEEFERHADAGAAGPRLIDGEGQAELSFGDMIAPLAEFRRQRLMRALERDDPAVRAQVDAMTRHEQFPDWVSGACLLVRRADAEAVGLLDERFFMYTEDVDFCASLRARGQRILFTPVAEIVHLRGRSARSAPAATRAAYRKSHLAFYRKHHPLFYPLIAAYHAMNG